MSKEKMICPACGSDNLTRVEKNSFASLTLGEDFSFNEVFYQCQNCCEEGDFSRETDNNFLAAERKAQKVLVKHLLENLNNVGITMALFERVFELPTRTLNRWKNGNFSASALALLRILVTYPWILAVAEKRFESRYAAKVVIITAFKDLSDIYRRSLEKKNTDETITIFSTNNFACVSNLGA